MKRIEIVEVGPRDGLQNESRTLTSQVRQQIVEHLVQSGLKRIEVGAFVSPKWVPQMTGSAELIQNLYRRKKSQHGVIYSALVPNVIGMEAALKTPIEVVAVFGACTEAFSQKNINCGIAESLERFRQVVALAKRNKRRVRGYLSVAFGCPFSGPVPEKKVVELVRTYMDMGIYEVSIGDTIGVATPKQVRSLLSKLRKTVSLKKVAMHFHDTRGTALANVLASLDLGVHTFDSSFGGLGGCPYANGASGNLATEDLVYMLQGMGYDTGVDLTKLLKYVPTIEGHVGHPMVSRMSKIHGPRGNS